MSDADIEEAVVARLHDRPWWHIGRDWLPYTIIAVAVVVGLALQTNTIRSLHRTTSALHGQIAKEQHDFNDYVTRACIAAHERYDALLQAENSIASTALVDALESAGFVQAGSRFDVLYRDYLRKLHADLTEKLGPPPTCVP